MSSTNRGGLSRQPHDFYETPGACVDAILDEIGVGPDYSGVVLDPGCGNGVILERVYARAPKAETYGVDIQGPLVEQARARGIPTANVTEGDFLTLPVSDCDLVIGNPPYKHALAFVERALACVAKRKGTVAMLLPEGFKGSRGRLAFHKAHPSDVFGLVPRPSFNGGGTDSTEYAWFVWGPRRGGRWAIKEWKRKPAPKLRLVHDATKGGSK